MTDHGIEILDSLGANYGTLTDAKRRLWHKRLEAFDDADIRRAVDRLLRDPRRERLPTLGQILDVLPSVGPAGESEGLDMTKAFGWLDLGDAMLVIGNPNVVPYGQRTAIVEHAMQCGHQWRPLATALEVRTVPAGSDL